MCYRQFNQDEDVCGAVNFLKMGHEQEGKTHMFGDQLNGEFEIRFEQEIGTIFRLHNASGSKEC